MGGGKCMCVCVLKIWLPQREPITLPARSDRNTRAPNGQRAWEAEWRDAAEWEIICAQVFTHARALARTHAGTHARRIRYILERGERAVRHTRGSCKTDKTVGVCACVCVGCVQPYTANTHSRKMYMRVLDCVESGAKIYNASALPGPM